MNERDLFFFFLFFASSSHLTFLCFFELFFAEHRKSIDVDHSSDCNRQWLTSVWFHSYPCTLQAMLISITQHCTSLYHLTSQARNYLTLKMRKTQSERKLHVIFPKVDEKSLWCFPGEFSTLDCSSLQHFTCFRDRYWLTVRLRVSLSRFNSMKNTVQFN